MQPWIKSEYDITKFKMNKTRTDSMNEVIGCLEISLKKEKDFDMQKMWFADICDMKSIMKFLKEGKIPLAIKKYQNLDTAARDKFPQWFWELAGCDINPRFFNPECTLVATEK